MTRANGPTNSQFISLHTVQSAGKQKRLQAVVKILHFSGLRIVIGDHNMPKLRSTVKYRIGKRKDPYAVFARALVDPGQKKGVGIQDKFIFFSGPHGNAQVGQNTIQVFPLGVQRLHDKRQTI